MSQEMDEEIRGFLSERAEKLHPGEPEIQEPGEREHSYCCQCHRLSKRLFQVTFKRINRTCVSRSEMMFMQLTLTLRRGCHQPERVRCLNEH